MGTGPVSAAAVKSIRKRTTCRSVVGGDGGNFIITRYTIGCGDKNDQRGFEWFLNADMNIRDGKDLVVSKHEIEREMQGT